MRPRRSLSVHRRDPESLAPPVLLRLMRLASPSLPVGGFSYSEGLEAAVDHGLVRDEAQTLAWLVDQLQHAVVPSELAVVARAAEAWRRDDLAEIAALNEWQIATREARELRQQSEQMGRSLAQWLRHLDPPEPRLARLAALRPAPSWPVAFALAGVATGAPVQAIALAFAAGWAEAMVQAALKAVPLGQSAGQRVLAGLGERIPAAVEAALALDRPAMQAFTPMLAILASRHEAQYSRLFRS
jgi:urease accessory protein